MLFVFLLTVANAQTRPTQNIPPCFCCESVNAYQLTPNPPPITGTNKICPCGGDIFNTIACPGAAITWTVVSNTGTPTITFTGQSTSTITLNSFVPGAAVSVTITVTISCGKISITNHIIAQIKPVPDASFPYSITANGLGGYTVTATAGPSAMALGNAWRFTEIVPANTPCTSWGYGSSIPGCTISGFNYLYQGGGTSFTWTSAGTCTILPGHTYRIIHWVEKCSATWEASDCRALKWVCFTITPSAKLAPSGGNAKSAYPLKGTKVELQNVSENNQVNVLTEEMLKESKSMKDLKK